MNKMNTFITGAIFSLFLSHAQGAALSLIQTDKSDAGRDQGRLSSDGLNYYALNNRSDILYVYSVDKTSGKLTLNEIFSKSTLATYGLKNVVNFSISPDGKNLYIFGFDTNEKEIVVKFERNLTTGKLSFSLLQENFPESGFSDDWSVFTSDSKFLYTGGTNNKFYSFKRFDNGTLSFLETSSTSSDINVRYYYYSYGMAITPNNKFLYIIGHGLFSGQTISISSIDESGMLHEIDFLVSDRFQSLDNLVIDKEGKFLYVLNNTDEHYELLTYKINEDGKLSYQSMSIIYDTVLSQKIIRSATSFIVSNNNKMMYISDEITGNIAVFNRNTITGEIFLSGYVKPKSFNDNYGENVQELSISPDDQYLYSTSAGGFKSDSVAVFAAHSDLELTTSALPKEMIVGHRAQQQITITNIAGADAVNSVLTYELTKGIKFIAATPTNGSCSLNEEKVVCALGLIPSDASVKVNVELETSSVGNFESQLVLAHDNAESNPLNNEIKTSVSVIAKALEAHPDSPPSSNLSGTPEVSTKKSEGGGGSINYLFSALIAFFFFAKKKKMVGKGILSKNNKEFMNFKSLFFLLAFSMVISLFGCSSDSNQSTPSKTQNTPQEQAAEKAFNVAEDQEDADDYDVGALAEALKVLAQPDEMKKMQVALLETSKNNLEDMKKVLEEMKKNLVKEEEEMKVLLSEELFAERQEENREMIKEREERIKELEETFKELEEGLK
jgi:6-phosphogluconolactonase (cycloisomerase 2 family)